VSRYTILPPVRQRPADPNLDRRYSTTGSRVDEFVRPGNLVRRMWIPPDISFTINTHTTIKVTSANVGRLDIIANIAYDDPKLWWVIAYVNDIYNPLSDMYVGQELIIPPFSSIPREYL